MEFTIKQEGGFKYIDEGQGEILLLLHGLFGALSNWEEVISTFSKNYRVVIPMMPIYEMPLKESSVEGLVKYIEGFVAFKNLTGLTLLGNSLGGHIGLIYALNNGENVVRMVLTGSSGLFEDSMGGSFPKRGNYEYIKERVVYTFYDPLAATKELIDEVFEITNNNQKCLRIINIARSAQRHNLKKDLPKIEIPTLLIWGLNDTITPPEVAHEFMRLLPNAELRFIDKCCHAPMMEHPVKFNEHLAKFLKDTQAVYVS
ncbi:MAG: alpha/beta hydrolase [Opitutaceae bacterium]|nr:alpha/beta hydrolase [Cytophagales bacterium]